MKSQANCCLVEKAWTCRFIPLLVLFVHSFTVFQRSTHSVGLVQKYFLKNALHSLTLTHLHRHLRFQQTRRFHVIYISFRSVVCARVFSPLQMDGLSLSVCRRTTITIASHSVGPCHRRHRHRIYSLLNYLFVGEVTLNTFRVFVIFFFFLFSFASFACDYYDTWASYTGYIIGRHLCIRLIFMATHDFCSVAVCSYRSHRSMRIHNRFHHDEPIM